MASKQDKYEKSKQAINELLTVISSYPVATTWANREKAKKSLLEIYKKGDHTTKGMLLAYVNEKLTNARDFRDFMSIGMLKEKGIDANLTEISKRIFDYSSSIEGISFFLSFLAEIDDELALKLLSFHLARYIASSTFDARVLSNKVVKELGNCNNIYALHILLAVAEAGEGKEFFQMNIGRALKKWSRKVNKVKASKKELTILSNKLDELLTVEVGDAGREYR
ncbi:MAG: hypothetical protein D6769_00410 [Methanobacteriota archaeon]|nr:MAG: hypothetical protein D6769_00410 [Euryarchaeota archaeon]